MNQTWVKIVLGLLLLGMLAANDKTRRTVIQTLIAFPIANFLTDILKSTLPWNRPYQDLTGVLTRVPTSNSHGTASAHAANMAAVAFVFVYNLKWWGTPWVAIALLTGFSRVYVGVHYPYQVLLGWCCGLVMAFSVTRIWDVIRLKRSAVLNDEPPDEIEKPN